MTRLLRRVNPWAAMALIVVAIAVLFTSVVWLARSASNNDAGDSRQAADIANTRTQLADVSDLASQLQAGLEKANVRLQRNGAPTVPVPTAGPGGIDGVDGADGLDGDTGRDGQDGTDGTDGSAGVPGSPGASGVPGGVGSPGPAGPQGPKGDTGATGLQGTPGRDGADGQDGAQGVPGQPGQPGADGKPPTSFTFSDVLGVTYTCTDPELDGDYTCRAA